jgi:hypothetical protein
MSWTFTLQVKDVNGSLLSGVELKRSTWVGTGNVREESPIKFDASLTFVADDTVINVILKLDHPRFSPLVLNLVRSSSEPIWRWTNSTQQILTNGKNVVINAVLCRIRAAPLIHIPEDELQRRATKAKAPRDADSRRKYPKKDPPYFCAVENLPGILISKSHTLRFPTQGKISNFHLAKDSLLGDEKKAGWERFSYSVTKNIDLAQASRLYLVEYGELGREAIRGPRFLIGVWVPNTCVKISNDKMDFVVWLHPNTRPDSYPKDDYPFTQDYPYALWSQGYEPYTAVQRYVNLPLHHLYEQHLLAYDMSAAAKSAVIVIPVIPTSHYELFESGPTLMRLLKELCLWIPRLDNGLARTYLPPSKVGHVVVSGFSASVPHIETLIYQAKSTHDIHYKEDIRLLASENVWVSPAAEFDSSWKEIWAIDGYFERDLAKFSQFVRAAVGWSSLSPGRRLCIYKNDSSDGSRWDPRHEAALQHLIRNASVTERGHSGDKIWAISIADPSGRWHVASFSTEYVLGNASSTELPKLDPKGSHEMMPRLMFGHAAVTSGLRNR